MSNLFAEALPEELKEVFVEPTKPKTSRIDVIGQNGNEGLHYESSVFAIQTLFSYGWDYVGTSDEDGLRAIYLTEQEALDEIQELVAFFQYPAEEWKVVSYNPYEDDTFARF